MKDNLIKTGLLIFWAAVVASAAIFATQYACNKKMPFDPDRAAVEYVR